MTDRYEPLGTARYLIEQTAVGEQIRIKAARQIFVLLFLPFWLAGWTTGGVVAINMLIRHFQLFLLFWLCAWAVGWVFAAGTMIWMLTGAETLRVDGDDLEIVYRALGFSRRRLYQGGMIRNLDVAVQPVRPRKNALFVLSNDGAQQGAVKFDYGKRTYFLAGGLDEAEAREVVAWLAKQLPGRVLGNG